MKWSVSALCSPGSLSYWYGIPRRISSQMNNSHGSRRTAWEIGETIVYTGSAGVFELQPLLVCGLFTQDSFYANQARDPRDETYRQTRNAFTNVRKSKTAAMKSLRDLHTRLIEFSRKIALTWPTYGKKLYSSCDMLIIIEIHLMYILYLISRKIFYIFHIRGEADELTESR